MPTIILVRHGETHWNRARRIQGHTDSVSPLTLKGIDQARRYGEALGRLTGGGEGGGDGWAVHTSPLARCVQSTAILCEVAGLDFHRALFDDRLKEVCTGAFSGLLKSELEHRHPALMAGTGLDSWYLRCPGGEDWTAIATRIAAWLAERRPGEKVVAVSHGVAGKVMRALYAGLDPAETLAGDSPQDAVFLLAGGAVERVGCG